MTPTPPVLSLTNTKACNKMAKDKNVHLLGQRAVKCSNTPLPLRLFLLCNCPSLFIFTLPLPPSLPVGTAVRACGRGVCPLKGGRPFPTPHLTRRYRLTAPPNPVEALRLCGQPVLF